MLDKYIIAETPSLFSLFSPDTKKAVRLSAYRPIVCICELPDVFFLFFIKPNALFLRPFLRNNEEETHMTFYQWIRMCLMEDAKKHPIPKACRRKLNKAIRRIRREQRRSPKNAQAY